MGSVTGIVSLGVASKMGLSGAEKPLNMDKQNQTDARALQSEKQSTERGNIAPRPPRPPENNGGKK